MNITYVTALPLVHAHTDLELDLNGDSELLANDYKVIKRGALAVIDDFEESFSDDTDVMKGLGTDTFILVSRECSTSIPQSETNIEKIERLLLALNIIGKTLAFWTNH